MDLDTQRQFYAEELRAVANLQSEALVQAFAKFPREHFLGLRNWLPAGARTNVGYRWFNALRKLFAQMDIRK